MQIDVRDNIKEVTKQLNSIQRKQIPFATSVALNKTAFDAQRAVKKNVRKKFINRNRWTESGVMVKKANKRNLISVVFMGRGREYMGFQEFGGTRRPGNRHIAVPQKVRRTKRTKIGKARRPRRLLDNPKMFKIDAGTTSHLPPGIYQRFKSGKLKMMYALETSTRYKPKLNFGKTVLGVVTHRFDKNFDAALTKALATMR